MATKTYIAKQTQKLSVGVTIDGHLNYIRFIGGLNFPEKTGAIYTTNDERVQKALESHGWFGVMFGLVKEVSTVAEAKQPTEVNVSTVAEAKRYLINNHELKFADLPNKAAVITKASELNIVFIGF
jgi:hypothetical protein